MESKTRRFALVALCAVLWAALAVSPAAAERDAIDLFTHEQAISVPAGESDYYSIELSGAQYRNARPDLADLRVRDSRGVYCPYVLNSSRDEETSEQRSYATAPIGVAVEKKDGEAIAHHDFQVVDFTGEGEVNAIALETAAADFSCQVRVFARTAKGEWLPVATDTVYRLDDVVKLSVEMDDVPLYQFWRITVDAPSPFASLSVTPRLDRKRSESRGFLKETSVDFSVAEMNDEGRTVLSVQNPDRLRLVSLTLETEALFKRNVELRSGEERLAAKQLYRRPSGGEMAVDTTIESPGDGFRDESFEIIIENRDDEPLRVGRITAQYRIDYLIFKSSGYPPYALLYGNESLEKPSYDIASYKDEILARTIPPVTLSAPVLHEVPKPDRNMGKTMFTVIVIVSACLLFVTSLLIFLKKPARARP